MFGISSTPTLHLGERTWTKGSRESVWLTFESCEYVRYHRSSYSLCRIRAKANCTGIPHGEISTNAARWWPANSRWCLASNYIIDKLHKGHTVTARHVLYRANRQLLRLLSPPAHSLRNTLSSLTHGERRQLDEQPDEAADGTRDHVCLNRRLEVGTMMSRDHKVRFPQRTPFTCPQLASKVAYP